MFVKSKKGYYYWEEFAKIDGLIHGFSTREFGDMNEKNPKSGINLENFLRSLGIENGRVFIMNQVHGDNVEVVGNRDSRLSSSAGRQARMTIINSADGLLTSEKGIYLVVTAADCVPVLFVDKKNLNIGVAHAGWKGVYKEIVKNVLFKMNKKGSDESDILVGIGPSIRVCCYNVYKERVDYFKNKFPKMEVITKNRNGRIFLDLIKIVKLQLKDCGILDHNILDSGLCTKDNAHEFYSFRKEGRTDSFGLSSGVIGIA